MRKNPGARRGAAAVELALVLPFLAFLFVIAVDWSRIFYFTVIVTSCARNGALYASDPPNQPRSPYASVSEARASIGRYLDFYNRRRPHSSLDGTTPDHAYFTPLPLRTAA